MVNSPFASPLPRSEKPTIMGFMHDSAGHHDCFETFTDFFTKSIIGIAPNLFRDAGNLHGFWLDPFYYILIRVWNNVLTESDQTREVITSDLIWKDFNHVEEANDVQKVMIILYKLYEDLYQLMSYKTFFDRNWKELWDIYFNVSDIFKNLCEKNNQNSESEWA